MTQSSLYPSAAPADETPLAPAVDRQKLLRVLAEIDGDTESLGELLREYLDDAPRLLRTMAQGIAAADVAALGMAAHTLKSTSASFGATPLATLCGELSQKTQSAVGTPWSEPVSRIATEFERVRALLEGPGPDRRIDVEELLRRIG